MPIVSKRFIYGAFQSIARNSHARTENPRLTSAVPILAGRADDFSLSHSIPFHEANHFTMKGSP
jgi:hypothetical protein